MTQPETQEKQLFEAVGLFDSLSDFEAAVDDLEEHGFDRAMISVMAGMDTVEEKLGHVVQRVTDEEDDTKVPRTCYIERESIGDAKGAIYGSLVFVGAVTAAGGVVASGGALAGAYIAAAMAGATGGLIGSVLADIMDRSFAEKLQAQLDKGGLLLWVQTPDTTTQEKAKDILKRHSGKDVHIHAFPVSEA